MIRVNDGVMLNSVGPVLRTAEELPGGLPAEVLTQGVGLAYEALWESIRMSPTFAMHFLGLIMSKFSIFTVAPS